MSEDNSGYLKVDITAYMNVEGLQKYIDQLVLITNEGAYLRVKDKDTGAEYEIRRTDLR